MNDRQEVFEKMEECAAAGASANVDSLIVIRESLRHPNWRVRYAAAVAAGDRRDRETLGTLVDILTQEDAAPLYSQKEIKHAESAASSTGAVSLIFPEGTYEAEKEAWRRRGRLKQAVCTAIGSIGETYPEAMEFLHRYAVDQNEDYAVRAAACKALGRIASADSESVLQQAVSDEEFCTRTEAVKALLQTLQE